MSEEKDTAQAADIRATKQLAVQAQLLQIIVSQLQQVIDRLLQVSSALIIASDLQTKEKQALEE